MKKIGIMQPYFFPYIGYFQLVRAVDTFVFVDDVNYIKQGWINRNHILVNGEKRYITIPVEAKSQNKKIKDVRVADAGFKITKTILHNYAKAPHFRSVFPFLESVLKNIEPGIPITKINIDSIVSVFTYLGLNINYELHSSTSSNNLCLGKSERIINICKRYGAISYINPIGGIDLYDKAFFQKNLIELSFLRSNCIEYKQFTDCFTPNLSIIDVIMHNSKEEVKSYLDQYTIL